MLNLEILKALSDETRLNIVLFLMTGKKNASQITVHVHKSQPNVSLALKQLLHANILTQEKNGREIYFAIRKPELLRTFLETVEDLEK